MENNILEGNILIVDDNPQNLRLLLSILNGEGYKVRPARSGAIALESAFSRIPDIVLLDIMMPEMDGYEVCRRLKENEATSDVPVIFISAMDSISEKLKAFDIGAVDYITKPFQSKEIVARVNTHLSLRRTRKQLEYEIVMRTASENSFQALSQKYDLILASAGEGILGIDKDCKYTFVNPAAASMLGYETADFTGKACMSISRDQKSIKHKKEGWKDNAFVAHIEEKRQDCFEALECLESQETETENSEPECSEGLKCPLFQTLKIGKNNRVNEWKLWRRDGTSFDAEFVSTPILDNDNIEGAVVIFSDISERKKMENELKRLATRDSLTGVANRRFFMESSQEEITRALRYKHSVLFMMMDIDHFKKINDTYGHHAGDVVLKKVSQTCIETLRNTDLFGRIGGEEFAAMLPETTLNKALQVAERLRKSIEAAKWEIDGQTVSCNVSIGMAEINPLTGKYDTESESSEKYLDDIIKKADEALYRAKNDGRNCIKY